MVGQSATLSLQVHRIRYVDEMGNGAILVCRRVERDYVSRERVTLQMPGLHMPALGRFYIGQLMRVSGQIRQWDNPRNGCIEEQLRVTHWFPILPLSASWAQLVAHSPHFREIGQAFAHHVVDIFGERLLDLIVEDDVATLLACSADFPPKMASSLGGLWAAWCRDTLAEWLSRFQLPADLMPRLDVAYGGHHAALQRLNADPYRLLAFGVSFRKADSIARKRFLVAVEDSRRLHGVVVHLLQTRYLAGQRKVAESELRRAAAKLLDSDDAASSALALTFCNGGFVRGSDSHFRLRGVWAKDSFNSIATFAGAL